MKNHAVDRMTPIAVDHFVEADAYPAITKSPYHFDRDLEIGGKVHRHSMQPRGKGVASYYNTRETFPSESNMPYVLGNDNSLDTPLVQNLTNAPHRHTRLGKPHFLKPITELQTAIPGSLDVRSQELERMPCISFPVSIQPAYREQILFPAVPDCRHPGADSSVRDVTKLLDGAKHTVSRRLADTRAI
jgi:hypothetical protein